MCERFGVLPNQGGLLQQEENHLKRMEKVLQAFDTFKAKNAQRPTPESAKAKAEEIES